MTRTETYRFRAYRRNAKTALALAALLSSFGVVMALGGLEAGGYLFGGLGLTLAAIAIMSDRAARNVETAAVFRVDAARQKPTTWTTMVDPAPFAAEEDGRHAVDTGGTTTRIQTPFRGIVPADDPVVQVPTEELPHWRCGEIHDRAVPCTTPEPILAEVPPTPDNDTEAAEVPAWTR